MLINDAEYRVPGFLMRLDYHSHNKTVKVVSSSWNVFVKASIHSHLIIFVEIDVSGR